MTTKTIELNKLIHGDCMDVMKDIPDKYFELAIVDPPYGLDKRLSSGGGKHKNSRFRLSYESANWDIKPTREYFKELFRVSQNQIIFGANYYLEHLHSSRGIICWDKKQFMDTFSRWEFAWTSFDKPAKIIELLNSSKTSFHPTQKPVALYKWLLKNYAKEGDRILDTHAGSCSSVIACIDYGYEYLAIEKDLDYYNLAIERINKEKIKIKLF